MERLAIGVVGLNFGGSLIGREIAVGPGAEYFRLKAVCDTDRAKAGALAAKHGVEAYYELEALLEDGDIQAVGLFTNPNGRAGLIRKIVRSGKDVITTKPFELDPSGAAQVLAEARERGRVVQLNSPPPEPPCDMMWIRRKVEELDLGRPVGCRAGIWTGYRDRPFDGKRWFSDPQLCPVAPMLRLGIYPINDILSFFDGASAVQIMTADTKITGFGVPDNAIGTILFDDGAIASVYAALCVHDGMKAFRSMVLNYQHGTVLWSARSGKGIHIRIAYDSGSGGRTEEVRFEQMSHGYRWDILYKSIKGQWKGEALSDEKIVEGVKVLDAFRRAELSGRTEAVR